MGLETIDIKGKATVLEKDKAKSRPGGGMIGIIPMIKDNSATYVAIVVERLDLAKSYNDSSNEFNQIGTGGARPCDGLNTLFDDIKTNNNRIMANTQALMVTNDNISGFISENNDLATVYCYTDSKTDAVLGDYTYQTAVFVFDPMTEAALQQSLLQIKAATPENFRKNIGYTPIDKLTVVDGKAKFPIFYPNPEDQFIDNGTLYSTGINNDTLVALLTNKEVVINIANNAAPKVAAFTGTLTKVVTPSHDNNNKKNDSDNNTSTLLNNIKPS